MSDIDADSDRTILDYAEELFAYLRKLGWESPDEKRLKALEEEISRLHKLIRGANGRADMFADSIDREQAKLKATEGALREARAEIGRISAICTKLVRIGAAKEREAKTLETKLQALEEWYGRNRLRLFDVNDDELEALLREREGDV